MSELRGLQLSFEEIRKVGGTVVAICPDPVAMNRKVTDRLGLAFPVLSDPGLVAVDAYGVRHEGALRPEEGQSIPRPATFVVDRDGVVRFRHLTDDWRVRPRAETLVGELRTLR